MPNGGWSYEDGADDRELDPDCNYQLGLGSTRAKSVVEPEWW